MHTFIGPNPNDVNNEDEDDEYVDPDIIEPVFFPGDEVNVEFEEVVAVVNILDREYEVLDAPEEDENVSSIESDRDAEQVNLSSDDDYEPSNPSSTTSYSSTPRMSRNPNVSHWFADAERNLGLNMSNEPRNQNNNLTNGLDAASANPVSTTVSNSGQRNPEHVQNGVKRTQDYEYDDCSDPKREKEECDEVEDDEVYSNPFVTAEDALEEEGIRGDRIGDTIYSERHVLKILMKWIEELPKYSSVTVSSATADDHNPRDAADSDETKKLEREFKKDMQLLWDMSSETDVMKYLVEKGIFGILHSSLLSSTCDRLTEITLGILANILSSTEILKKFQSEDQHLKLIEAVISVGCNTAEVPILIQVFAVLQRVAWFMRNVKPVDSWLSITVSSSGFMRMLIYILKSSSNVLLIKESVLFVFTMLETLIPSSEEEERSESERIEGKYLPFATSNFVSALCEANMELLKVPEAEAAMEELIDDVQKIPPHLQQGIRSGLGALCYIHKVPEGQVAINTERLDVTAFLTEFFKEFGHVTANIETDKALEYFVAGLNLLSSCHTEFPCLRPEALLSPVLAAQKFVEENAENYELTIKDIIKGVDGKGGCSENSPMSTIKSVAIVTHEYIGELQDKFGKAPVLEVLNENELRLKRNFLAFSERVTNSLRLKQTDEQPQEPAK